ncbi:hypothetical protein KIPB_014182, partial [Kipferlia bialata]|eukprot:g14182.t1
MYAPSSAHNHPVITQKSVPVSPEYDPSLPPALRHVSDCYVYSDPHCAFDETHWARCLLSLSKGPNPIPSHQGQWTQGQDQSVPFATALQYVT